MRNHNHGHTGGGLAMAMGDQVIDGGRRTNEKWIEAQAQVMDEVQ